MIAAAQPSLIAVRLPAGRWWLRAVEDIWSAGNAILPLPVDAPDAEIRRALEALRPAELIEATGTTVLDEAHPVERGTAAVVATSGSTGHPKGAVLSWDALSSAAAASTARLGATSADRWLAILPLHHIAGLGVVIRSRAAGVAPVIHDRFDVATVAAERDCTMVSMVPTMLRRVLDARADVSHLRCVVLGGAPAGRTLMDEAARAGLRVVNAYGSTETSGGCVYDGVPLDGVEAALADDGRIRIAGPLLFSGYRLRDDLTQAVLDDGWYSTEDLGRIDDSGRLQVLGRADDVIITGGEKVRAAWLAELLETHPGVAEAAVAGQPDDQWGERVVAFVVACGEAPSLGELRDFVRQTAPAYAAPRDVVVVDALPRLPSGKVDRLALWTGNA